jgi:hypothetical protein
VAVFSVTFDIVRRAGSVLMSSLRLGNPRPCGVWLGLIEAASKVAFCEKAGPPTSHTPIPNAASLFNTAKI